jgi:hypothetical protein
VLVAVALAAIKPYPFLVLGPALGLYLLARLWRERRIAWPVVARGALAAGAALPVLAYMALVARESEVIREWWAADVVGAPSPPLWAYALGYIWLWPLALLAAAALVRRAPLPGRQTSRSGAAAAPGIDAADDLEVIFRRGCCWPGLDEERLLPHALCWAATMPLLYPLGVVPRYRRRSACRSCWRVGRGGLCRVVLLRLPWRQNGARGGLAERDRQFAAGRDLHHRRPLHAVALAADALGA